MDEILPYLLLNISITAAAYLIVPLLIVIMGKSLTISQIRTITIINGICVWLVFAIIRENEGIEGSGAAVFLWASVGHAILKKCCLVEKTDTNQEEKPKVPHASKTNTDSAQTSGVPNAMVLQSAVITGATYKEGVLTVRFTNGERYSYFGVPRNVYEELCNSQSPGKFFQDRIQGVYIYKPYHDQAGRE